MVGEIIFLGGRHEGELGELAGLGTHKFEKFIGDFDQGLKVGIFSGFEVAVDGLEFSADAAAEQLNRVDVEQFIFDWGVDRMDECGAGIGRAHVFAAIDDRLHARGDKAGKIFEGPANRIDIDGRPGDDKINFGIAKGMEMVFFHLLVLLDDDDAVGGKEVGLGGGTENEGGDRDQRHRSLGEFEDVAGVAGLVNLRDAGASEGVEMGLRELGVSSEKFAAGDVEERFGKCAVQGKVGDINDTHVYPAGKKMPARGRSNTQERLTTYLSPIPPRI